MISRCRLGAWTALSALAAALVAGTASPVGAQQGFDDPDNYRNGRSLEELMSGAGYGFYKATRLITPNLVPDEPEGDRVTDEVLPGETPFGAGGEGGGGFLRGRFRNVFVNDPCLDPARTTPIPADNDRVVQSETEIAILNSVHGDGDDEDDDGHGNRSGRLMVAGYNDSYGFYDNRQGLSGFSYSTNGGKLWIDASGLPPRFPVGGSCSPSTPGQDCYFGDPVVVVHHRTKLFYFASLYQTVEGYATLSVNRGRFKVAPQQVPVESKANTRCEDGNPPHGVPDPPPFVQERIIWDPPVAAVLPPFLDAANDAFLDKEWLYVDQKTGVLYLTYTRFSADGSTPIELVRSFDQGQTWTPPAVIVPNLSDGFNQATMPVVTPTGRVIVTWFARTFPAPTFVEREQRIEAGFSDNCRTPTDLCTFGPPVIVTRVNPQGEPPGYNRARPTILNAPAINVDLGRDDGEFTNSEKKKSGFGNVYITYFSGKTPFAAPPNPNPGFARAADIFLSTSRNNGTTYDGRKKVNDDNTQTTHVFPSVQVNQEGRVFVTWIDRRVDPARNFLNDTWGDLSKNHGASLGGDVRITDVSTDWFARADAAPNFGDYNSSELINFQHFVSIWADGRFPRPTAPITCTPAGVCSRPRNDSPTPDTIFEIFGNGSGGGGPGGDDDDD